MRCRVQKPTHRPGDDTRLCHQGSGDELKSPLSKSFPKMKNAISHESNQGHPNQMGCRVHKPTHRPGDDTLLLTEDRCQQKSIARHSQSVHRIRRQIDGALTIAEGEASRQQERRQPTSITRHSQPRHRSVTTTKHSHSLVEGGASRQQKRRQRKSIARHSQSGRQSVTTTKHSHSLVVGGASRQRQMPTEKHRKTFAAGPSIESIAKSTEHSHPQRVARLSQSVRQRSSKLDGMPSARAN
jgi:hypothetical protein